MRNSQSTIYLKSHGWVHGFQNEVSLIKFSTMFCQPCSLSRNRSLRYAKSARHLFVWFAKHCLAEHCLLFRGDADECEKVLFRASHLFSVFWLSFVAALTHCLPNREAVCTIFMMVFGMTWPGGKLTTYPVRGWHTNH